MRTARRLAATTYQKRLDDRLCDERHRKAERDQLISFEDGITAITSSCSIDRRVISPQREEENRIRRRFKRSTLIAIAPMIVAPERDITRSSATAQLFRPRSTGSASLATPPLFGFGELTSRIGKAADHQRLR